MEKLWKIVMQFIIEYINNPSKKPTVSYDLPYQKPTVSEPSLLRNISLRSCIREVISS